MLFGGTDFSALHQPENPTADPKATAGYGINHGQLIGSAVDFNDALNDGAYGKCRNSAVPQAQNIDSGDILFYEHQNAIGKRASKQGDDKGKEHKVGIYPKAIGFIDGSKQGTEQGGDNASDQMLLQLFVIFRGTQCRSLLSLS